MAVRLLAITTRCRVSTSEKGTLRPSYLFWLIIELAHSDLRTKLARTLLTSYLVELERTKQRIRRRWSIESDAELDDACSEFVTRVLELMARGDLEEGYTTAYVDQAIFSKLKTARRADRRRHHRQIAAALEANDALDETSRLDARHALRRLDAHPKGRVLMRLVGGDAKTIADELGMTAGSVRAGRHRTRERLRPLLEALR